MEFKTSDYNNSLLNALTAANDTQNGDPCENIVVINSEHDLSDTESTGTFNYVRIKGEEGSKPEVNDYKFTALRGAYIENIAVKYSSFSKNNTFITITPFYVTDAQPNIIAEPIDIVIRKSCFESVHTLLGYSAPSGVPTNAQVSPIRNIIIENCSFKTKGGKMIEMPCACNRVLIQHNRYDCDILDNTDFIQNFVNLGTNALKCNNVEIAFNKMYSTKPGVVTNSAANIESHFCKVYSCSVSVHDNIYNGFTLSESNTDTYSCEPIYIIGSSNTNVYRNKLENFSVGKGAITLEKVFDRINVSENIIYPGDDTNQGTGRAHNLIHFKSIGGTNNFNGTTKVKIASNNLTYHRKPGWETQLCSAAINFSGREENSKQKKIEILVTENNYSGINHFVRFVQKTKNVKIDVSNNEVRGFGLLNISYLPTVNLLVVGSTELEIAPTVNIVGNTGNVSAICSTLHSIGASETTDITNIYIADNNMYVRSLLASGNKLAQAEDGDEQKEIIESQRIKALIVNNSFAYPVTTNRNHLALDNCFPIYSDSAEIVMLNNKVFYENSAPRQIFRGGEKHYDGVNDIKCNTLTVIGNEFIISGDLHVEKIVKNLASASAQNGDHFIEGYFINVDQLNNLALCATTYSIV